MSTTVVSSMPPMVTISLGVLYVLAVIGMAGVWLIPARAWSLKPTLARQ